jgi:hypothetical protein
MASDWQIQPTGIAFVTLSTISVSLLAILFLLFFFFRQGRQERIARERAREASRRRARRRARRRPTIVDVFVDPCTSPATAESSWKEVQVCLKRASFFRSSSSHEKYNFMAVAHQCRQEKWHTERRRGVRNSHCHALFALGRRARA